ncbi:MULTISPECIES: antirestriction protein ArdA [Sphingobacterium]|uniref:Antirestriction protein n=1 Tax=Sphingobacterium multivorum TaxID=28454 RepID=A0A2X2LRI5_SPHMU|nr:MULTISPECIES: antirestriction protein ArdA [Sphingobacterium]QRQ60040.1 antirestriction protein ArdA [Sphingobacterium multivorum]SPZ92090.1 Antirestriction protein [Sphingobacterium multivorum]HBI87023.1 antirestriction protein [Sphingobacterium sp.]
MLHQLDITEARVYVGTFHKYSTGSLYGKWLELSDYYDIEEFYEACKELHADEEYPEFMYQDYENIPEDLINEYCISANIFEVLDAVDRMDQDHKEPFLIWCDNLNRNLAKEEIYDLISRFEEDYQGEYDDEEDFAREIVGELYDLPSIAKQYFDYEAFARDLFMTDYWFDDGFVFRKS